MTQRKLIMPILLVLTLSILSPALIPTSTGYNSPVIYIYPDSIIAVNATQISIDVMTNYTGNDIWGYEFTLTYNPLILSGDSVTNGNVTTQGDVTFIAGTFDNNEGKLTLTSAYSLDQTTTPPTPVNNTGPGILATVTFNVTGTGETPITLGPETKLKSVDGSNIVDGPFNLVHGYFRNIEPAPTHDVAVTGVTFHHEITATSTYNETQSLIYIEATTVNEGDVTERFTVEIYYRLAGWLELVKAETINVAAGDTVVVTGGLNTTGFPVGYLTIIVEASEVYNETETINNTYSTTLLIKMVGDVQGDPEDPDPTIGDGDVDKYDFGTFAYHFGKNYPNTDYNPECDFNRDGKIDKYDFGDLAYWYGKSISATPPYPIL
ncbi:hypothetical protein DRO69_04190 [Candidatus Bathyarchaeota archaeon]|nr:MAG: hypothetical protein DRO69_04190 [Candidatus Bathyarchaeota archaeon]